MDNKRTKFLSYSIVITQPVILWHLQINATYNMPVIIPISFTLSALSKVESCGVERVDSVMVPCLIGASISNTEEGFFLLIYFMK